MNELKLWLEIFFESLFIESDFWSQRYWEKLLIKIEKAIWFNDIDNIMTKIDAHQKVIYEEGKCITIWTKGNLVVFDKEEERFLLKESEFAEALN